ncbi:MAG: hypothetical protein ACYC6T_12765 [Thermoleophilia bacterium]
MIRMQIQFTEQQARALRAAAQHAGISQSEVVRRSVDSHLGVGRGPDRETLRSRALALVGAFAGTETDVAVRHDDYLADAIAAGAPDATPPE